MTINFCFLLEVDNSSLETAQVLVVSVLVRLIFVNSV